MANPISVPSDLIKRAELDPDTRTPPEKSGILPLTPPASSERQPLGFNQLAVLKTLDDCRVGSQTQQASIKLRPKDHEQLTEVLKDHPVLGPYTQDKLRFDYDPRSELLCIRMPTPVHEYLSNAISNEISEDLKTLRGSLDDTGQFASRIKNLGSSRIFLRENIVEGGTELSSATLKREPDAQFQHQEAAYPGVVLEVSYSQDGKDLDKLAWDYIQCSNGDIKVVIGLDVNYGSASSTISVWRPKFVREEGEELDILDVEQEIVYQPFRSPTGEPLNQAQHIRLTLNDFATDELCEGLESRDICISYGRLAQLLDEADNMQRTRESRPSEGIKSGRKAKRRKRPSSSPDRLASEDEAQFRLDEDRAKQRIEDDNADFLPPVRKRTYR